MMSIALAAIVVLLPFAIYGVVTLWRRRAATGDHARPSPAPSGRSERFGSAGRPRLRPFDPAR